MAVKDGAQAHAEPRGVGAAAAEHVAGEVHPVAAAVKGGVPGGQEGRGEAEQGAEEGKGASHIPTSPKESEQAQL